MVKLLCVIVFNHRGVGQDPPQLLSHFDLSSFSFFQRGSVQEICTFASRETTKRCAKGQTESVVHGGYHAHTTIFHSGLAVACVTDSEYPTLAARGFLRRAAELFQQKYPDETLYQKVAADTTTFPVQGMEALLAECQDPTKADKMTAIKQTLDETKEIVLKNIDALLERGETLDNLLERSNDLSFQSKAFAKKSEDLNSCCVLF